MNKTEARSSEPVSPPRLLGEAINGLFSKLTSPSTLKVLCTGFLAASLLIFSLLSSIVASIYFYNTFIPPLSVSRPVFLQYGNGVPFGSVQLGPSVLSSDQSYDVFLELEAPASQKNLNVGNFMAALTVLDAANNTLAYTSRPASLEYKSFVHRTIRQMWGMTDVQKLRLPLLERFVPGSASSAVLLVGRPQAELHTYASRIIFDAHFSGLRYLMHSHRITAFVVLSTTFFCCEIVSALIAWAVLVSAASSSKTDARSIEAKEVEETPRVDRKPSLKELTDSLNTPTSPELDDLLSSQDDEDPDKKPAVPSSSSMRQRRRSGSRAGRSVFESSDRSKRRAPGDEALVSPSDEESTSSAEDTKPLQGRGQGQPQEREARADVKDDAEEDNILLDTSPPNSANDGSLLGGGRKDQ